MPRDAHTEPTPLLLIRTPLRRQGDLTFGGPLRVRAQGRSAYAAFTSEQLARAACEHWAISGEFTIESWPDAARDDGTGPTVRHLLVFGSARDFDRWLRDPAGYLAEGRLVPVVVPGASPGAGHGPGVEGDASP